MLEIRGLKRCGLFKPGHDPHWIQINRSNEDKDNAPLPGRLVDARSDGTIDVAVEQEVITLWNHDLGRMIDAIAAADGQISYQAAWHLIWVPSPDGRYAFCVSKRAEHLACPDEVPTGTPAELLERAGGFTVRIGDFGHRRNET